MLSTHAGLAAVALAAAVVAAPASAQWTPWAQPAPLQPAPWQPALTPPPVPASGAVIRFYENRGNTPIWFRAGPRSDAATQFLSILHRSTVDGFAEGPRLAAGLQQAIRNAQFGGPPAMLHADRLLSTAWVRYVQAVRSPSRGVLYGTDEIARPTAVDAILRETASAPHLVSHVRSVSDVNPVYAQLRDAAWNLAQMTGGVLDRRVMANLERARAFPSSGRYVVVDVASQQLFMFEDGQVRDSMKVIVGKREQKTPMIASMIHFATFNPYWNVPDDLVRSLIAPNVLNQGTSYLQARGYEVVLNWADNAPRLAPEKIDWKAVAAGRERIRVRQKPGPANSMGDFKFSFANPVGIYLHDTPQKELFNASKRTLSNGCVRLEDAPRFARWLLGRSPVAPSSAPEQHVQLAQGVPVFLTYLTVRSDGARLTFTDDVYDLDGAADYELAAR
ncbi:L,D-transpeptidase family protein [Sphingomonas sp.]|uniref:L,D-transpeptidase family protein n=1 Tax=Sphingomonas sp. TaxID=28214 RepID=UPI0025FCBEC0|nr:L,D-transpeptidase family protein [Sphingomonas sp.]